MWVTVLQLLSPDGWALWDQLYDHHYATYREAPRPDPRTFPVPLSMAVALKLEGACIAIRESPPPPPTY